MTEIEEQELKRQIKLAKEFISSLAWIGDNCSSFKTSEAIGLQNEIHKRATKVYKEIFKKSPFGDWDKGE